MSGKNTGAVFIGASGWVYLHWEERKVRLRLAVEARHESWLDEKAYGLLREHNAAWVISHAKRYPYSEKATADFVYARLHGPGALYASRYQDKDLKRWARKIRRWRRQEKDVFVYFNNDSRAYAPANAARLKKLVGQTG